MSEPAVQIDVNQIPDYVEHTLSASLLSAFREWIAVPGNRERLEAEKAAMRKERERGGK